MPINVFVDNFTHPNAERAAEISACIKHNQENKDINYHLLNSPNRMTYQDLFDQINKFTTGEDINVISNIDIFFDNSIFLLNKTSKNQFIALTRYEVNSDGSIFFDLVKAKYSQDVWAWRGKNRIEHADFFLGLYGCDNRIAAEANNVGYELINPSFSIKAYHFHMSNIRADDYLTNKVPEPYSFVFPMVWK